MAPLSHFTENCRIIIKPKAILANIDGPEGKKRLISRKIGSTNKISTSYYFKRISIFILVLMLPISVYAGVVGAFLGSLFKASEAQNLSEENNVQNMALLASTGSVGRTEKSLIVQDDAMLAQTGPLGTNPPEIHRPNSDQISVYVVREGDTLSQIAEMFNVTVNTIKWGNDLDSNSVKEGQVLVILPISGVKHVVVKGETVESLAKKYKGSSEEIISYNNLEEGATLAVGTEIIIPDGEVYIPTTSSSGSSSASPKPSLKDASSFFVRPITGGRRTQGLHGYNAVDIAAPAGTEIRAAAGGEVIISRAGGWNGGYGTYIVIKHSNGTQTLYAHNSKNFVSVGDTVTQGEAIGLVGNTGKSTGAHLHFEVRGAKNPF